MLAVSTPKQEALEWGEIPYINLRHSKPDMYVALAFDMDDDCVDCVGDTRLVEMVYSTPEAAKAGFLEALGNEQYLYGDKLRVAIFKAVSTCEVTTETTERKEFVAGQWS